jgi:cation:H+ antiporter
VSYVLLVLGLGLLVAGGDVLVRSAASLASRLGVSPLVIGLTVVAFGTSAPELAATLVSSLQGAPDIGIGNVVGSNVANVGLILGLSAIVASIAANEAFLRRDLPIAIAAMVVLVPLTLDGMLGRWDGLALLTLLAAYLAYLMRSDGAALKSEAPEEASGPLWRTVGGALLGLGLLLGGAEATVRGAVDIATALGVPERVIGLTLVAFGTSLPELASAVAAAARRQGDMILGNIAGSNIFNVLAVLGVASSATRLPASLAAIGPDLAVAVAFSVVLLATMAWRAQLGRAAGVVLFGGYLAYVTSLFVIGPA